MTERDIGRETSNNLVEIRTVLSRAETALERGLSPTRREYHIRIDDPACSPECPGRARNEEAAKTTGRNSYHGYEVHAEYPDPDYDEAYAALKELVTRLDKFRRAGTRKRRGF